MHPLLLELKNGFELSNDISRDSTNFLLHYNKENIAEHSSKVASEAKLLAQRYGIDDGAAEIAGYFHDISGVIPNEDRLKVSYALNINVLPEEEIAPSILHQKISKVITHDIFGITDLKVLDAISCHTTLRANASDLDKILFIADKLQWDQEGNPPYIKFIREGMNHSLSKGVYNFIKYLMDNKSTLKVIHPWLVDAYKDLSANFEK